MFWHLFKYKFRCVLGDRMGTFWLLLFPLMMSVLFQLSFPSEMFSQLEQIPVAVVDADETMLSAMEESGLFEIQQVSAAEALPLLEDETVKAIVTQTAPDALSLRASESDFSSTILKYFLDTYLQRSAAAVTILNADGSLASTEFFERLSSEDEKFISQGDMGKNTDTLLIFYYGLIGMATAMGMTYATDNIRSVQANQSAAGMRMNLSPARKLTVFTASTAASVLIQFCSVLILLVLLRYGYGLDLGGHPAAILLLSFMGCLATLSFGSLICALLPGGENLKIGILIGITMLGTTCSGMMSPQLRYMVYSKFPAIGYISLPNIISDGFYALYYYDSIPQVMEKVAILLAFAVVGLAGTTLVLRRQSYKSL